VKFELAELGLAVVGYVDDSNVVVASGVVKKCLVVFIKDAVVCGIIVDSVVCGNNVNIPRLFVGLFIFVVYVFVSVVGSVVVVVEIGL
jgi:hypothetical protein